MLYSLQISNDFAGNRNLVGELFVGPRTENGPTTKGEHYSNTGAEGNIAIKTPEVVDADWTMQSLCSAHLSPKHQYGPGIGCEDNLFVTNEEWITYNDGSDFVGIFAHAIDLDNKVDYALGVFTQGGFFEKIVELNSKNPDLCLGCRLIQRCL